MLLAYPKIRFVVDFRSDCELVYYRLTHLDPAGIKYRMRVKGFDSEFVHNFEDATDEDSQKIVTSGYLSKYYYDHEREIISKREDFEGGWEVESEPFFHTINTLFDNCPWAYNEYIFLVSSFYSSQPSGNHNRLACWYKRHAKQAIVLQGHELTMTHVYEFMNASNDLSLGKLQKWALAEIIAYIGTQIWQNKDVDQLMKPEFWAETSYPQLYKPAVNVVEMFKNRNTFAQFIAKSIKPMMNFSDDYLTNPQR